MRPCVRVLTARWYAVLLTRAHWRVLGVVVVFAGAVSCAACRCAFVCALGLRTLRLFASLLWLHGLECGLLSVRAAQGFLVSCSLYLFFA